jgi:mono/diheme cytochrome c family protein
MDFPIFHLDFIGNRMLIAVMAIVHVIINHAMAVGGIPLVVLLEWRAFKRRDEALDHLAWKIAFVLFVITTSVGALTGVGIWFTTALVNPDAIGSLIRVFFWGWFSEWLIFVLEVLFIMWYFLTWKKMQGAHKHRHILLGAGLSLFSWLTMAIITGILGFMMNSGRWIPYYREWTAQSDLLTAFLNPLYLPQLAFRTPYAMIMAGVFFMFLIPFFTHQEDAVRQPAIRTVGWWNLLWLPLALSAAVWYWLRIPEYMALQAPVAITTQNFITWQQNILGLIIVLGFTVFAISLWGAWLPRRLPGLVLIVPFLIGMALLGLFERVREFVRKPYVIQNFMYANGLRVRDYPLYQETGLLAQASYVGHTAVTPGQNAAAGRDVFMLACSRCHTVAGVNSVDAKFQKLFPAQTWQPETISAYIENMHQVRTYMPPFPGNAAELQALASFIVQNQQQGFRMSGAQDRAVIKPTAGENKP